MANTTKYVLLAAVFFVSMIPNLAGATATISGKILDRETGESIPGVSVMVEGTERGAAANVEGFFSIADLEPGRLNLVLSALGYRSLKKDVELADGQDQHLVLRLIPEAVNLNEVEIIAEREGEREYTPKVAQYSLETKELAAMPRLAEPDLFRALQAMPGILATSDFSSELNIWGGSSDQNLILLNGIDVYKPTHLGGLFSVFNMDAIKDVKLIKGGFPAKYGGRLSAVVDVADREGNRNKVQGKLGLSMLSAHGTLEGPIHRGSWLVAGRRTYLDGTTKAMKNAGIIEDDFPYYFYDVNAKITRDFPNGDRISPSAYLGRDVLHLTNDTDDRIRMTWGNNTFSIPYVKIFNHKWFSTNTVAGSFYDSDFRFETSDQFSEFKNNIRDVTFKTDISFFATPNHTFDFGAMAKSLFLNLTIRSDQEVFHDRDYRGMQYAAYISDDYRPTILWTITPGFRIEHNTLSGHTEYLPRLSVKHELSATSNISAAAGLYAQPLQQVTFGDGFASMFNSYVLLDKSFNTNRAWHYALTYENDWEGPFKLTAGAFYKSFDRIIEYNPYQMVEESDDLADLFTVGKGYAWGGDVLFQGEWGRYTFMWGYGLARSNRQFDFWGKNEYPAIFDRLHNANLLASRKIGKNGRREARYNDGSRQPLTKSRRTDSIRLDQPPYFFQRGPKNGYRMPEYHRLDLAYRVHYDYQGYSINPYVEIINVYNHKNVLALDYDLAKNPVQMKSVGQLPFLPSLGLTVEF
ncbi:TonB-dependent receptor [candidate division KSB1 bacterium]|nr:MAG: TonB-dependent receptor [candidate division KSB1 bacterium]